jgi:predicted adenine nucleotide alpha hydrolase (AANH) superfamily ATPase
MSVAPTTQGPERLLLHICCGPCASGAVPFFQDQGVEILALFFNPNIHPLLEFRRRVTAAKEAAEYAQVRLKVDESYDPEAWFRSVTSGKGTRCDRCIAMRLDRAAEEAAAEDCAAFSTSLSISPWQDHQAIKTWGETAGREHGVSFVYEDLRPRYRASRDLSRSLGLYRQKYCGCLVSEWERYRGSA